MKAMLAAVLAALFGLIALAAYAAPLPQSGVQSLQASLPADEDKDQDKEKKADEDKDKEKDKKDG